MVIGMFKPAAVFCAADYAAEAGQTQPILADRQDALQVAFLQSSGWADCVSSSGCIIVGRFDLAAVYCAADCAATAAQPVLADRQQMTEADCCSMFAADCTQMSARWSLLQCAELQTDQVGHQTVAWTQQHHTVKGRKAASLQEQLHICCSQ